MSKFSAPHFHDPDAAREHLEAIRWPDGPVCPHCGEQERVYKVKSKKARPGLYLCGSKTCRKQFSVTVGTLFEGSHVGLDLWFQAAFLLAGSKKGISAHQLHRILGVTYKTAWFMAHRLREAMKDPPIYKDPLGGDGQTVEADETYIGGVGWIFEHGKGWRKKRGTGDKYKIVALVERGGRVRSFHVDRVNSKSIRELLVTNVDRDSHLKTDEAMYYRRVGEEFKTHGRVHHAIHEYVRGETHTNTIEGFFSIFKRGMKGVYQHCGERHLKRYLGEFDFRYNTRHVTDLERMAAALLGIGGKRLTYRHS